MRAIPALTISSLLAATAPAIAQTEFPRAALGPVVRYELVRLEGNVRPRTLVYGLAANVRLSRRFGLGFDLTQATEQVSERTFEGPTVSYAPPGSSQEEIEAQAIWIRTHLTYRPRIGAGAVLTTHGQLSPRVGLMLRTGIALRQYAETDTRVVTKIPEGVDPQRIGMLSSGFARSRIRGGIQLGVSVPIELTQNVELRPAVNAVLGPVRIGNRYQAMTMGVESVWSF